MRDLSGTSNDKQLGQIKKLEQDKRRNSPKHKDESNNNVSPPRINIIKQKVNLNKINVAGNNSAFVNHSQNFQNSKRPNFGGGLAHASNNVTTQNRLGMDTRNPVLATDEDDQAVYEEDEFESIIE
jgi:hypothetical protein